MTTLAPLDNPNASWHCNDCDFPFLTRVHVGGLQGGLPRSQTKMPTVCSNPDCVRSDPRYVTFDSPVPDQP